MKYYDIGSSFWELLESYFESLEGWSATEDEELLIDDIKHFIMEKTDHDF